MSEVEVKVEAEEQDKQDDFTVEFREMSVKECRHIAKYAKKLLTNIAQGTDIEDEFAMECKFMDMVGPGSYVLYPEEDKIELGNSESDTWNRELMMTEVVIGLFIEQHFGDKKK